jgi:hypothetical protein
MKTSTDVPVSFAQEFQMSHQQPSPVPQQPTKTAPPTAPNGPQPISHDWLRRVSGGIGETDTPHKGW